VVAAGLRRQPDFARGDMTIDDDLRAVGAFDFDHAAGLSLHLERRIVGFACRRQRGFNPRQGCIGLFDEFLFIHRVLPSFAYRYPASFRFRHAYPAHDIACPGRAQPARRLRHQNTADLAIAASGSHTFRTALCIAGDACR
jgi:hypothetical protein